MKHTKNIYRKALKEMGNEELLAEEKELRQKLMSAGVLIGQSQNPYGDREQNIKINIKLIKWKLRQIKTMRYD